MMSTANDASLTKSENDTPSIVAILANAEHGNGQAGNHADDVRGRKVVHGHVHERRESPRGLAPDVGVVPVVLQMLRRSGPPARRRNAAEFSASAVYPLPTSESLRAVAMSPARSAAIRQMLMGAGETIPPARYRSIRKEATASSPPRIVL